MWFDFEQHSAHIFFLRIIEKRVSSILFSNQLIGVRNSQTCGQLHLKFRARNHRRSIYREGVISTWRLACR